MLTDYKKLIIWSLGVFVLIFFSANIVFDWGIKLADKIVIPKIATVANIKIPIKAENIVVPVLKLKEPNIRLAFVGDIMLDRGVEYMVNKNFAGDYKQLFAKVQDQLQSYNLLFANLEGPVSDKGSDIGGLYSFRMEPKVISALKEVGFDVFSLANNHTFNWGAIAFTDTLRQLLEAGIAYTGGGFDGQEAYVEKVLDIGKIKIAFLAFSEFRAGGVISSSTNSGIALISEKEIKENVSRARLNNDLVIVSYHFGEEYQIEPNNYQRKYAKLAIDAGADLIIGHHPHVVQTLEQYKNTYMIYSLGNFIFDQNFSAATMQGGMLEVEVNPESKQIEKIVLKKVNLNNFYQVESIE